MALYACIILKTAHPDIDRTFDYEIPQELLEQVVPGRRVAVPFGANNKKTEGYVIEVRSSSQIEKDKIKRVSAVLDDFNLFSPVLLELAKWMKEKYYTTLTQCLQTIMPSGIGLKTQWVALLSDTLQGPFSKKEQSIVTYLQEQAGMAKSGMLEEKFGKSVSLHLRQLADRGAVNLRQITQTKDYVRQLRYYSINREYVSFDTFYEKLKRDRRLLGQKAVVDFLEEASRATAQEIKQATGVTASPIQTLLKKGVILESVQENRRNVLPSAVQTSVPFILTKEQEQALSVIEHMRQAKQKKPVLLHGITGSGKTEVYLQAIAKVVAESKQAIVLVPEISLTPQTVERFVSRLGDCVCVTHSRMNQGERFDQWKKARDHEVAVMIGPRSALFTPFDNLGIVIIDEEHEGSYSSDTSPKYCAKQTAQKLCELTGSLLLLGSATPAVQSYYKAEQGEYLLVEMKQRTNQSVLPQVEITDMRREMKIGNLSIFGGALHQAMIETLHRGEQAMLFLNRRGFSTFVSCRSCGHVMTCRNCNVSYTYHKDSAKLVCHYCGAVEESPAVCPACGSKYIKYFGTGTQKVESEVGKLLPSARILRMDYDTVTKKNSHVKILEQFRNHEADILIGTQMIAKGHDFPLVTLVGILAADLSLYAGSYQAGENTFQLITQTAGRAGRAQKKGFVYVQTYAPENYSIIHAANQDYKGYYKEEIRLRQSMEYPPFSSFFVVLISGRDKEKTGNYAKGLGRFFEHYNKNRDFTLLGPAPSALSKIKKEYRWQITIKYIEEERLRRYVLYCIEKFRSLYKENNITISLTLNPRGIV